MASTRRRSPSQARSRAMVERILSAGARVLEARGYQEASTNRIAREAGISPGSLYQYYPDKDAIVAEIILRLIVDFASAITPALRRSATEQPPDAIRLILGAFLDALQQQTALLRALADRVPAIEQQEALRPVRGRLADFVHHSLASNMSALRHADLERTTWMIVELAQHLLVRYTLDEPHIERDEFLADSARVILDLAYRADLWTGS